MCCCKLAAGLLAGRHVLTLVWSGDAVRCSSKQVAAPLVNSLL